MAALITQAPPTWREIMRKNFTRVEQLYDFLQLSPHQQNQLLKKPKFILNLPLRLALKIQKGTLEDPILKQFIPTIEETRVTEGFVQDPVGDTKARCGKKILHKYKGRALLVCTSACVMHCRYCFRQNFDYEVKEKLFIEELAYIAKDPTIHEVILSGGDPLSLSDEILEELLLQISAIPQIQRIRFHSRFPVGIPERINDSFLESLKKLRQQIYFVIHCNHPNELGEDLFQALDPIRRLGGIVMNQAVLLRGVNDDAAVLENLFKTLSDRGVLPYYLHQLDRVQGAAHFEVPIEQGRKLMQAISARLPGYAVPKYVQEIAGEPGKSPIHF
jgi:EF-P beta-lysylation protein EpmB